MERERDKARVEGVEKAAAGCDYSSIRSRLHNTRMTEYGMDVMCAAIMGQDVETYRKNRRSEAGDRKFKPAERT